MAFADPQSITVAGTPHSMPRITVSGLSATYQQNDKNYTLKLSHQESGNRVRSVARVDQRAVVADELTGDSHYQNLSVYVVIERPLTGFSSTQVNDLVAGLKTWLDSTNVGKLYGEES